MPNTRRIGWAAISFLAVTLYTYVLFFVLPSNNVQNRRGFSGVQPGGLRDSVGQEGSAVKAYAIFLGHVVRARAANDRPWPAVDHGVPHRPGLVVSEGAVHEESALNRSTHHRAGLSGTPPAASRVDSINRFSKSVMTSLSEMPSGGTMPVRE